VKDLSYLGWIALALLLLAMGIPFTVMRTEACLENGGTPIPGRGQNCAEPLKSKAPKTNP